MSVSRLKAVAVVNKHVVTPRRVVARRNDSARSSRNYGTARTVAACLDDIDTAVAASAAEVRRDIVRADCRPYEGAAVALDGAVARRTVARGRISLGADLNLFLNGLFGRNSADFLGGNSYAVNICYKLGDELFALLTVLNGLLDALIKI
jgi:hypothetical protein